MMGTTRLIGPGGALNLEAWLTRAAQSKNHVDPYTVWSLQTGFRQFRRNFDAAPHMLDFLVELDAPVGEDQPEWPISGKSQASVPPIPPIYRSPLPGSDDAARHVTVRLRVESLEEARKAVVELVFVRGVLRSQIGFPRPDIPGEDATPPVARSKQPRAVRSPTVVLGVLEDGCPFGHAALMSSDGGTRVVALWDQTAVTAEPRDPHPKRLGYGRERLQPVLDELLAKHTDARGLDEEALYLDPAALQPRLRECRSHGAAVITLLAGRSSVLPTHSTTETARAREADSLERGQNIDDEVASAPVVVVQFPREQIDVAGARWLVVRALDGLRYLADVSARLGAEGERPLPLVVNMSYGSVVGAHDGTGLFETAMEELAAAHGRMAIVLAAGNSKGCSRASDSADDLQRLPSGCHAVHEALSPGTDTRIRLYVPPSKPIETYLEMWFDDLDQDRDKEQFLGADDIAIRVTSPAGDELNVNSFPGMDFDSPAEPEKTCAGLLCFSRVAQSQKRSMALLVVAATQISVERVEVPSGVWTVTISNQGNRRFRVQAWVERDLVPRSDRNKQAARLLAGEGPDDARLDDINTFNNIATGLQVFRVGALTAVGKPGLPRVSPYSSSAANAEHAPEFSAVADETPANPGIRVSGNSSGSVVRVNGTSVAAPQAARWLANRMAAGATLRDIREYLEAKGQGDELRGQKSL